MLSQKAFSISDEPLKPAQLVVELLSRGRVPVEQVPSEVGLTADEKHRGQAAAPRTLT
jgi:hypothetical protein